MNTIRGKDRCHLVEEEMRAVVEETRTYKPMAIEATGSLDKMGECS